MQGVSLLLGAGCQGLADSPCELRLGFSCQAATLPRKTMGPALKNEKKYMRRHGTDDESSGKISISFLVQLTKWWYVILEVEFAAASSVAEAAHGLVTSRCQGHAWRWLCTSWGRMLPLWHQGSFESGSMLPSIPLA